MSEWEVKNKIVYPEDTIDIFSLKIRDEFELIYKLLNRLRSFGAATGNISDTVAYQPYIDKASGKLLIRNENNSDWIELGSISESFLGIKPEDIGAAKKLVGNKSAMPETAETYDIYFATDEKRGYYYSGTNWELFLSLNFEDFANYKNYCVARDEVDYFGKDKILRLDKNTGKGNIDITGSAEKIAGIQLELTSLANNHAIVFDSEKNKFVNKPKDEISKENISSTGEANKIVQTDEAGIANISISGSAKAVDGVLVNLSGVKDGQVLIYNATTKNLVPATDIAGSAQKINGIGINLADLENGKAIAYDAANKKFVADKNNYLTEGEVSDSGEINKLVKLGADKIIKADISGSAEKIAGIKVESVGIKDGQVFAYDILTKTLKPVNKDYFGEKSVSEIGEVGKLVRIGGDKTVHANLDGSASKVDNIDFNLSGIKNNQLLGYDSAAKEIVAKDMDTEKICGIAVNTAGIKNGQVLVFKTGNKFEPADKDFVTSADISTTGEVGKLIKLGADKIIQADISGSAKKIDGVKISASNANDGDILVYHAATNSYEPESKSSAGEGKYLVLKNGTEILVEYNGAETKELDISPLTKLVNEEAAKLTTARKIKLTGKATGETSFDGSKDVELNVTALNITSVDTANNSATANKLKTARKISIGGKVKASAVNFDGSSDINLNVTEIEVEEQKSVEKLKTPRKISVTGDAAGVIYFDGSEDVTLQLEVMKASAVTGTCENAEWASQAGSANYAAESAAAYLAVQDYEGNTIHETYVKKSELAALVAEIIAKS